jgi:hypothetical protein
MEVVQPHERTSGSSRNKSYRSTHHQEVIEQKCAHHQEVVVHIREQSCRVVLSKNLIVLLPMQVL